MRVCKVFIGICRYFAMKRCDPLQLEFCLPHCSKNLLFIGTDYTLIQTIICKWVNLNILFSSDQPSLPAVSSTLLLKYQFTLESVHLASSVKSDTPY